MNADSQLNTKIPTVKSEPPQLSNPKKHFERKKKLKRKILPPFLPDTHLK